MQDKPINKKIEEKILKYLDKNLKKYDLVMVHDYGHGLITKKMINILEKKSKFLSVNAQINAGNLGYNLVTKYNKAEYYCLDLDEARKALHDKHTPNENIPNLLLNKVVGKNIAVTMGAKGSLSKNKNRPIFHMPSFSNMTVDTMGAGDAYYILSAPVLHISKSIELSALIGNLAGAIKIGIPGHTKKINKSFFMETLNSFLKTE